jgi:hypothetical protein
VFTALDSARESETKKETMSKEEILTDEEAEKVGKKQRLQLSKFEEAGIERFSPSSFNAFRTNRITWALRYIFEHKSRYWMFSAYRGNVIENEIKSFLSNEKEKSIEEHIQSAIENYHHAIISNLFKDNGGVYDKTIGGFDKDALAAKLKTVTVDKFPAMVADILRTHNKLNSHLNLPAFTNPDDEDFKKQLIKMEKEYILISQGVTEGIKYFSQFKGQEIKMQQRLECMAYDLVIPTIAYSDFETKEFIYELKTVAPAKFPKDFSEISLGHKTQAAFNSKYRNKVTKLIYVSSISESVKLKFHKDSYIYESAKIGMSVEDIFKSYRTPDDGKTTKNYVSEFIAKMQAPDFVAPSLPEAIRVFDFTLKDAERFDKVNYVCAQAINTLFEKANKNNFTQDIKFLCWSDPEGMLVDKDQKEAIQSIWGIELQESEEESE